MVEENKIKNFERLVVGDAAQKRDAAMKQLREEKASRIEAYTKEADARFQSMLKREMEKLQRASHEQLSDKLLENKKQLLQERERLIDALFDRVRAELAAYITTDAYIADMSRKLEEAVQALGADCMLTVDERDEKLLALVKEKGYAYQTTAHSFLGGCKVESPSRRQRIDLTFSTRLADAYDSFLETYRVDGQAYEKQTGKD